MKAKHAIIHDGQFIAADSDLPDTIKGKDLDRLNQLGAVSNEAAAPETEEKEPTVKYTKGLKRE
jgi:hypothetical protein